MDELYSKKTSKSKGPSDLTIKRIFAVSKAISSTKLDKNEMADSDHPNLNQKD